MASPSSSPPPSFYCPISLDLMTDPVTLSSGISYDRASIQPWFASGHRTCPVTRQPLLPHPFFIPNHTLLRIIRAWCHTHSQSEQSIAALSHSDATAAAASLSPEAGRICMGPEQRLAALSYSQVAATASSMPEAGHIHISGGLCVDALLKLGLLVDGNINNATTSDPIPHEQAASLLTTLLSHYCVDACHGDALAKRTCEEALAALSILPLSSHHLSTLAHPHVFHYLSDSLLHSSHHQSTAHNSAYLLAKLVSQHPSPKPFLRSLSPQSLTTLSSGLSQFLKVSNPSQFLTQLILHCLCLLCKSSRTALLSLTATCTALAHAALDQLLHSARLASTPISETALSLLQILAACAEGRAAIVSHAFAVPTITKFLQRSASEGAIESAVVVLWKLCRYSSEEKVRRQAMAACVPSKLVLLMQASHCSTRAKTKAGALVRLLIIGETKSRH